MTKRCASHDREDDIYLPKWLVQYAMEAGEHTEVLEPTPKKVAYLVSRNNQIPEDNESSGFASSYTGSTTPFS